MRRVLKSVGTVKFKIFKGAILIENRSVSVVVNHIAIGAEGLEFNSRAGRIGHGHQRLATAAIFLRSCVAAARRRGNEPSHWLHAST